ncbi:MAG: radical SAM protein [Oscillospiraceae bacterium]|nr:radical SAM protein [Oscillospiraceae bacterium]MDY6207602.1 radical SAM protein [Oscillospiraceae bacterium]
MSHSNISIFIPHMGCPNACSFCDQRIISSTSHAPTPDEAEDIIRGAYEHISSPEDRAQTEIAFFGGSFTAIDRDYMVALLERASKYLKTPEQDGFRSIRISTRPDCIDEEILMLLKKFGVGAIELGAQSMRDSVLNANLRGHTAEDVKRASRLIKEMGFELGLQMMVGLYKSTHEDEIFTMNEIIGICPKTVRIYPVAVLRGTYLAELFDKGEYVLYPFDECISLCARLMKGFTEAGIKIIRLGLHAEESVEDRSVAGFYHPALGELVRSEWVKGIIENELSESGFAECRAANRNMSILVGHKRSNRAYFADKRVSFIRDDSLPPEIISVNGREFTIQ